MSVANVIRQISPGDKIVHIWDMTRWLGSSTINTVTWTSSDSNLTISDDSATTTKATAYFSVPANTQYNETYWVTAQFVTNDTVPRTESRDVQVKVVRKTG